MLKKNEILVQQFHMQLGDYTKYNNNQLNKIKLHLEYSILLQLH